MNKQNKSKKFNKKKYDKKKKINDNKTKLYTFLIKVKC